MRERVEKILHLIEPELSFHGGGVELVEVDEKLGVVKVRLIGGCASCPMAEATLKNLIEDILKKEIPEVKEVVAV
jgi:Fe-S cluster biogenesis protein NfuA